MSASPLQRLLRYAPDRIGRYDAWVAHVNAAKPSYSGAYGIWQHSWKGSIPGISGDVDLDYAYRDYPTIIRRAGLNGWKIPAVTPATVPRADYEALQARYDALEVKHTALFSGLEALLHQHN